ncbi:MAG: hypothetical protein HC811_03715 [Flammeovirgaceae bacterium]|nr:hypothetical protein [Flammeovirgaceae bacterium]
MINKLSFRLSVYGVLFFLSLVIIFHILILTQVIPFQIVWGGRLETLSQMRIFETISIFINVLMLVVVADKADYLKLPFSTKTITIILWVFVVLFAVNTIGNLFSKNRLEQLLFSPLTLLAAILFARIAIENHTK